MRTLIGRPRDRELSSATRLLGFGRQNVGNNYAILLASFGPEVVGAAPQLLL